MPMLRHVAYLQPVENHAQNIVQLAVDMRNYINERNSTHAFKWKIRTGISTGNVFAGLIGKEHYHFDVFGDTVNTSARMQQYSAPMQINMSEETAKLITGQYKTIERVPIEVKGKGVKRMHYLFSPLDTTKGWDDFKNHPLHKTLFAAQSHAIKTERP
jgi:adenylate cyclase